MQRRQLLAALAPALTATTASAFEAGRELGEPRRPYGERAAAEQGSTRFFGASATPGTGASRTPLQDSMGIITPSSLHFERHHSGVPTIDAAKHELLVHGLVDRPLIPAAASGYRYPASKKLSVWRGQEGARSLVSRCPATRARLGGRRRSTHQLCRWLSRDSHCHGTGEGRTRGCFRAPRTRLETSSPQGRRW